MDKKSKNDLGLQPIAGIISEFGLKSTDLVRSSTEQLTYKMVNRAVSGRRLTPKVQLKVVNALNNALGKEYKVKDIFNY